MEDCVQWAYLPEPVLAHIFSLLPLPDRYSVNLVCKHWNESLNNPIVWKRFNCPFHLPADVTNLRYVKLFGRFMSNLQVQLNQQESFNRENAVHLLKIISQNENINLTHLSVSFKQENPLFYSGIEFTSILTSLFIKCKERQEFSKLTYLNFNGLMAKFTNDFIDSIATNCPNLTYLNILNKVLVCNVSPEAVKRLGQNCRKLNTLHLYHISFNDDVVEVFSQSNRAELERLGIVCRREQKCMRDISSTHWSELVTSNPKLVVELGFDHTCPEHRIAEIMTPEIPVVELHLITMTRLYPEVNLACSYYANSLEKLAVYAGSSIELDQALLQIAQDCKRLHTLLVYCVVEKTVIDQILDLCPAMRKKGSYILKWELEPEPWTVGTEEGE